MRTYICEICGDAYLGSEKPRYCPFCGAPESFIKDGHEANPIFLRDEAISQESKKYLMETFDLEVRANAFYVCVAEKTRNYEIKAMFKRLARVEFEHAVVVTKLLGLPVPQIISETCDDMDIENFKKTLKLETRAVDVYLEFQKKVTEQRLKLFFNALWQAEQAHIELMNKYLKN